MIIVVVVITIYIGASSVAVCVSLLCYSELIFISFLLFLVGGVVGSGVYALVRVIPRERVVVVVLALLVVTVAAARVDRAPVPSERVR